MLCRLLFCASFAAVSFFHGVAEKNPVTPAQLAINDESELSGTWQIEWDDLIDGQMEKSPKKCNVDFEFNRRKISGKFNGKVLGKERDAKFFGELYGGEAPLFRFVQQEDGYVCSYQISWTPQKGSVPTGVWHDTNGSCGEFTLLKYQ